MTLGNLMNRKILLFLLALFISYSIPRTALADVYRYTDEAGQTHYVTNPEAIPKKYRSQASNPHALPKINRSESVLQRGAPKQTDRVISPTSTPRSAGSVQVFVTSWCPYCRQLEAFLKKNNVTYKRWDVERSKEGLKRFQQLGGGGVPVVQIGSQVLRGFDEGELSEALKIR